MASKSGRDDEEDLDQTHLAIQDIGSVLTQLASLLQRRVAETPATGPPEPDPQLLFEAAAEALRGTSL